MDIKFETTPIPQYEPKRMDFGKIAVCSACGSAILGSSENPSPTCCGELITLKKYVEEIRGEKFNNEDWAFQNYEQKPLLCLEDKDIEVC
jgi:hypothetical protein